MNHNNFRLIFVALAMIFAIVSIADAQKKKKPAVKFTSAYTDMGRDCKILPEPAGQEVAGDPAGACKGFGGYRIFVSYSAWSASFSAQQIKNPEEDFMLGTDYADYGATGEKIEWRMANGKPFAVIMRIYDYQEREDDAYPYTVDNRAGSKLIVRGLAGYEQLVFEVDGTTPNANAEARRRADAAYQPPSKSGKLF